MVGSRFCCQNQLSLLWNSLRYICTAWCHLNYLIQLACKYMNAGTYICPWWMVNCDKIRYVRIAYACTVYFWHVSVGIYTVKCWCRSQGLHLPRYQTFYSIHWYNVVGFFFNFSPIQIKMICHQHLEHLFLKSTSMGERAVNQIPRAWLPPRSLGYSWWGFEGMDTCIYN